MLIKASRCFDKELSMRGLTLRAVVALFLLAPVVLVGGAAIAATETTGTPAQQQTIDALLQQYPDGGQALADAIAQTIEADPSFAAVAVAAALNANAAEQTAIGTGLAEAAVFFANSNTPGAVAAQQLLQSAIGSAPTNTTTAFTLGGGTAALLALLGGSSGLLTTDRCISPNLPGSGCTR
jgi:hypothetical protein